MKLIFIRRKKSMGTHLMAIIKECRELISEHKDVELHFDIVVGGVSYHIDVRANPPEDTQIESE